MVSVGEKLKEDLKQVSIRETNDERLTGEFADQKIGQPSAGITCFMPDARQPTLQDIAADRDWWLQDSGSHYRELATWLREVAGRCRLPNPQREMLILARRYERRAEHLERKRTSGQTKPMVP